MAIVDLELFKRHCNVDNFNDDDELMEGILEAAEEAVILATRRSLEELQEMAGGKCPAPLRQAVLMLGAPWYNQRESVTAVQMHAVPDSLQALVKPYRKLANDTSSTENLP